MASTCRLNKIRVLFLENSKVALSFPVPDAIGCKEEVHFFQGALVGFWVEGPDHRDGDNVAGGEDVVCFFVEGLEHYGAEEREPAVADGPADYAPRVALGADFEGEYFCGVEPGNSQPSCAKGGCEEEYHGYGSGCVAFSLYGSGFGVGAKFGEAAGEKHGYSLDNGAPVERPAATDAVESENADKGGHLNELVKELENKDRRGWNTM